MPHFDPITEPEIKDIWSRLLKAKAQEQFTIKVNTPIVVSVTSILEELEQLVEQATSGDWEFQTSAKDGKAEIFGPKGVPITLTRKDEDKQVYGAMTADDAALVCKLKNSWPAIVSFVRQLAEKFKKDQEPGGPKPGTAQDSALKQCVLLADELRAAQRNQTDKVVKVVAKAYDEYRKYITL